MRLLQTVRLPSRSPAARDGFARARPGYEIEMSKLRRWWNVPLMWFALLVIMMLPAACPGGGAAPGSGGGY
jgi:hypothetical protein